ncbi:hypothetical protein THRCLA_08043, partial [Thraustotheca clavata]
SIYKVWLVDVVQDEIVAKHTQIPTNHQSRIAIKPIKFLVILIKLQIAMKPESNPWWGITGFALLSIYLAWIDIYSLWITGSFLGFVFVRYAILPILSSWLVKTPFKKKDDWYLWLNTFGSLVHSIVSFTLSAGIVYMDEKFFQRSMVTSSTKLIFIAVAISTGYFVYDLFDLILHRLHLKAPGILLHHANVCLCYISALIYRICLPYQLLLLLLELNSIFLHTRKLLSMIQYNRTSSLYCRTWDGVWLTFLFPRTIVPLWVHYHVYLDRHDFNHFMQFALAFTGLTALHWLLLVAIKLIVKNILAKNKNKLNLIQFVILEFNRLPKWAYHFLLFQVQIMELKLFLASVVAFSLTPRMECVGLFAILFYVIREFIIPRLSSHYVIDFHRQTNEFVALDKRLLWLNTIVSLVHSLTSMWLSLGVILYNGQSFFESDWVHADPSGATFALSLSTGYFIYDFYDLVQTKLYVKGPGILAHHIMVGACYLASIFYSVGESYLLVMLLLELNSVFLHGRKLMAMAGFTMASSAYALAWQGVWVTFVVTRGVLPLAVHYTVYLDRTRFPHVLQFAMAFGGMSVLHVLNFLVMINPRNNAHAI